MVASSVESIKQLEQGRERLDALLAKDPDVLVPPADQQGLEHAIAVGVAVLAGEDAPAVGVEPSTRQILAKDLRITTDLVLRALRAHS